MKFRKDKSEGSKVKSRVERAPVSRLSNHKYRIEEVGDNSRAAPLRRNDADIIGRTSRSATGIRTKFYSLTGDKPKLKPRVAAKTRKAENSSTAESTSTSQDPGLTEPIEPIDSQTGNKDTEPGGLESQAKQIATTQSTSNINQDTNPVLSSHREKPISKSGSQNSRVERRTKQTTVSYSRQQSNVVTNSVPHNVQSTQATATVTFKSIGTRKLKPAGREVLEPSSSTDNVSSANNLKKFSKNKSSASSISTTSSTNNFKKSAKRFPKKSSELQNPQQIEFTKNDSSPKSANVPLDHCEGVGSVFLTPPLEASRKRSNDAPCQLEVSASPINVSSRSKKVDSRTEQNDSETVAITSNELANLEKEQSPQTMKGKKRTATERKKQSVSPKTPKTREDELKIKMPFPKKTSVQTSRKLSKSPNVKIGCETSVIARGRNSLSPQNYGILEHQGNVRVLGSPTREKLPKTTKTVAKVGIIPQFVKSTGVGPKRKVSASPQKRNPPKEVPKEHQSLHAKHYKNVKNSKPKMRLSTSPNFLNHQPIESRKSPKDSRQIPNSYQGRSPRFSRSRSREEDDTMECDSALYSNTPYQAPYPSPYSARNTVPHRYMTNSITDNYYGYPHGPKSSNKIVPSKYAPSSITDTYGGHHQSQQDSDQSEDSEDDDGPVMTLSADEKEAESSSSDEECKPSSNQSYFTDVREKNDLRRKGFPPHESRPERGYDPYVEYGRYSRNPYETPQYRRWPESRYPYYPQETGYMPPQIDPRYSEPYGTGGMFRRQPGIGMDRRRTMDYRSKYGQQTYPAYGSSYIRSGPTRPQPPETMTRAEYDMQRMEEFPGKFRHPYDGAFYTEPRNSHLPKAGAWGRNPYHFRPEEEHFYRVHEESPVVHKSKYQKSKSITSPPVRSFSNEAVEVIDYSRIEAEQTPPTKPRHAAQTRHSVADDCLVVDMSEFRKPKPKSKQKKRLKKRLPTSEEISIVTESSDNESLMQYPTKPVPFSQFLVTPAKVSKQMHKIAAKQKTKRLKPSMLRSRKILKRAIQSSILSDYESSICGDPQTDFHENLNFSTEAVYGTSQEISFEDPKPPPRGSISAPKPSKLYSKDGKSGKDSLVSKKSKGKEILSVKPGSKLYSFKDPMNDQRLLPEVPAIFIDDSVEKGTVEEPYEDCEEQAYAESNHPLEAAEEPEEYDHIDENELVEHDKDEDDGHHVDAIQDENLEDNPNFAEMEEESDSEDNQDYGFDDDEVLVLSSDNSEETVSIINPFLDPETENQEDFENVSGAAALEVTNTRPFMEDLDVVEQMHSNQPFNKAPIISPKNSKSEVHEQTKDYKKSNTSKESGTPPKMQTNKVESKALSDTPPEILKIINISDPNPEGPARSLPKRKYRSAKAKEKASKELPLKVQNQVEILPNDAKESPTPKTLTKQKSTTPKKSPISKKNPKPSPSPKSTKSKKLNSPGSPVVISEDPVDHKELSDQTSPSRNNAASREQIKSQQQSVPVRRTNFKSAKAKSADKMPLEGALQSDNIVFLNRPEIESKTEKKKSAKSKSVQKISTEELHDNTEDTEPGLESSQREPESVIRVKKYKAAKTPTVSPEEPHSVDEHDTEDDQDQVDLEIHEFSVPELKDVLYKKITVPRNFLNPIVLPVVTMRKASVHPRTRKGEAIHTRAIRTQIQKEWAHLESIKEFADPYNFSDDESPPSVKSSIESNSDSEIRYSLVEPEDLSHEDSENSELGGVYDVENNASSPRQNVDDASDILGYLSSSDEDSNTLYSLAEDVVESTDDLESQNKKDAKSQSEAGESNEEENEIETEMEVEHDSDIEEKNQGNKNAEKSLALLPDNGIESSSMGQHLQSVEVQESISSQIPPTQKSDETVTPQKNRKRQKSKENKAEHSATSPNLEKSPITGPKQISKRGRKSGSKIIPKVPPKVPSSDPGEPAPVKRKRGRPRVMKSQTSPLATTPSHQLTDKSLISPEFLTPSTSSESSSVQSIKMSIPKSSMSEKTTRALDKYLESGESTAPETCREDDRPGTPDLFTDSENVLAKDPEMSGHDLDEEIEMDERELRVAEKSLHDSLMKPLNDDHQDDTDAQEDASIEPVDNAVQTKLGEFEDVTDPTIDESTAGEFQNKKQSQKIILDQERNQQNKDSIPQISLNEDKFESGNVVEVHSGIVEEISIMVPEKAETSKPSLTAEPVEPKLKGISKCKTAVSRFKASVTGKQPSTSTPKFVLNQHQSLKTGLPDISEESSTTEEGDQPMARSKVKSNKKLRRDAMKKPRSNSSKYQASTSKSLSVSEAPLADTISDISSISTNSEFVQKDDSLSITGVQYMNSSMDEEDDEAGICVMDPPPTFIKSSTDAVKKAADSTSDIGKVRRKQKRFSAKELKKQANDHWKKIAQGPSSLHYDKGSEILQSTPINLTDVQTNILPANRFQLISSYENFDPNIDEVTSQQKIKKGAHEIEDILENMSSLLDTLYGQERDSDSDEDMDASRSLRSCDQNKSSQAEEMNNSFTDVPDEDHESTDACVGSDLDQARAVADQVPPPSVKKNITPIKSPRISKSLFTPPKSASPLHLQKLDHVIKSPAVKKLNLSDPGQSTSKPSPNNNKNMDESQLENNDPQIQDCLKTDSEEQDLPEDAEAGINQEPGQDLEDVSNSRTLSVSDNLLSYTQMNETTQSIMDKSLKAKVAIEPLEKRLVIDGVVWKRKGSTWKTSSSNVVKSSFEISQFLKDMRKDAITKDSSTGEEQEDTSTKELTDFERAISRPKNLIKKVRKIRIKRLPTEDSETLKTDNASTRDTSPEKIKLSPRKPMSPKKGVTSPKKVTIMRPKSPSQEIQAPTSKLALNILKKKQIEAEKLEQAQESVFLELPGSFESMLRKKAPLVKTTKLKPQFDSSFKIPSKKNLAAEEEDSEFVSPLEKGYKDDSSNNSLEFLTTKTTSLLQSGRSVMEKSGFVFGDTKIIRSPFARKSTASAETSIPIVTSKVRNSPNPECEFPKEQLLKDLKSAFSSKSSKSFTFGTSSFSFDQKSSEPFSTSLRFLKSNQRPLSGFLMAEELKCPASPSDSTSSKSTISSVNKVTVKRKLDDALGIGKLSPLKKFKLGETSSSVAKSSVIPTISSKFNALSESTEKPLSKAKDPKSLSKGSQGTDLNISKTRTFGLEEAKHGSSPQKVKKLDTPKSKTPSGLKSKIGSGSISMAKNDESAFMTIDQTGFESKLASSLEEGELRDSMSDSDEEPEIYSESESLDDTSYISRREISHEKGSNSQTAKPEKSPEGSLSSKEDKEDDLKDIIRSDEDSNNESSEDEEDKKTKTPVETSQDESDSESSEEEKPVDEPLLGLLEEYEDEFMDEYVEEVESNVKETKKKKPAILEDDFDDGLNKSPSDIKVAEDQDKKSDVDLDSEVGNSPESTVKEQPEQGPPLMQNPLKLTPKSYCYNYVRDPTSCRNPDCHFKHQKPSKEECIQHVSHQIHLAIKENRPKDAVDYFLEIEKAGYGIIHHFVKPVLFCCYQLGFTYTPIAHNLLGVLFNLELLDANICDGFIQCCSVKRKEFSKLLWEIFEVIQSLNIQPTPESVITLLMTFYECKFVKELFEIMIYSNELDFTIPLTIRNFALTEALNNPVEYLMYAVKWIQQTNEEFLMEFDYQLLEQFINLFVRSKQMELVETLNVIRVRKLRLKDEAPQIEEPEIDREEARIQAASNFESPQLQKEEKTSHAHRIQGCKLSYNWEYLAQIFLDLCSTSWPRNTDYIDLYIDTLTSPKTETKILEAFKKFLEKLQEIVKVERKHNVLLEFDTRSLSQICCGIIQFCCSKHYYITGFNILEQLIQYDIKIYSRNPDSIHQPLLIILEICNQVSIPLAAVRVLEDLKWLKYNQETVQDVDKYGHILDDLIVKSVSKKLNYQAYQLLSFLIHILESGGRDIEELSSLKPHFNEIIMSSLSKGVVEPAIQTFQLDREKHRKKHVLIPVTLRTLFAACNQIGDTETAQRVFNYAVAREDVYIVQENRRKIVIGSNLTFGEIEFQIRHYLLQMYRLFCNKILSGEVLSFDELKISIVLNHMDCANVPFLSTAAPQCLYAALELIKLSLGNLNPPISYNQRYTGPMNGGIFFLNPSDVQKYMHSLDSRETKQGLRFTPSSSQRGGRTSGTLLPRLGYPDRNRSHFSGNSNNARPPRFQTRPKTSRWN